MGIYIWTGSTRHWSPNGNTIGYWELNGNGNDTKNDYGVQTYTATDYDSTGYSGAGNPSYVSLSGGKQCAYFDGTRVLNLPYLPIPSNTITISMWVKFPSSSRGSFFSLREDLSESPGWAVRAGVAGVGGALWYSYVTSSPTEYDFNNVTTTENERHNIIFTFNGGTGKYYVDGDLEQTTSGGTSLRDANQSSSHIGGEVSYNSTHYGLCYLSDIIYENTTRTSDQVADYYNQTKGNYQDVLPSTYQEVTYIQSSGTQYINTGYTPTNNTKIRVNMGGWTSSVGQYANLFGARATWSQDPSTGRGFHLGYDRNNNAYFEMFGKQTDIPASSQGNFSFVNGSDYEIEMSQSGIYQNSNLAFSLDTVTFTSPVNMCIFCDNDNGTASEFGSYKLYSCKMWESGTLVRDFVPCYRKNDSVIGLYDLVNDQFYTNAGTGTFTKGSDV